MPIQIKLQGFEDLIKEIEKAEGSALKACESAVRQSAAIMQSEIKSAMSDAGVPSDLINDMPAFEIEKEANEVKVRVGYKKGAYFPSNISDGYKVLFLNYGTPNRTKHGKIIARGFIQAAKKNARPKIKKQQQEALKKVLERLKK